MEREPGVQAEADQVAIALERGHGPEKDVDGPVRLPEGTPDHLIGHGIDGAVTVVGLRNAVARGVGEGSAGPVEALVREALAVAPDAELVKTRQRSH